MAKRAIIILALLALPGLLLPSGEKEEEDVKIEDLFQVRMKEVHFNLTPTYKFVWPDTSAKIGIKQKWDIAELAAETEYNYLYSEMRYALKYTMEILFTVTGELYDQISFEKIYENSKFLQRNRGFEIGIQTPETFGFLTLRQTIKNETVYFSKLEESFSAEDTNVLLFNSWMEAVVRDSNKEKDLYFGVNLENAVPHQVSEYNFIFLNMKLEKYFGNEDSRFALSMKTGHLLEDYETPVWKKYTLGGVSRLIGYDYNKFRGYYMNFARIKYRRRIFKDIGWELPLIDPKSMHLFIIADAGAVGEADSLLSSANYMYGIGAGAEVNITFRKRTKMKFTFIISQPSHGSGPYFYFIHRI